MNKINRRLRDLTFQVFDKQLNGEKVPSRTQFSHNVHSQRTEFHRAFFFAIINVLYARGVEFFALRFWEVDNIHKLG